MTRHNKFLTIFGLAILAASTGCSESQETRIARDDFRTIKAGDTVTLNVLDNDFDPDNALDTATTTIVEPPVFGTLANHNDGTFTYSHNGAASLYDSFSYTVADKKGSVSNTATVNITLPGEDVESPEDCVESSPETEPENCVVSFFDGKSLTGVYSWLEGTAFEDPMKIFTIDNGLLHVSGNALGALISTQEFRNFRMVLEFKWGKHTYGKRAGKAKDAGVFVHSKGVEGGVEGKWLPGIQSQIMEGSMGDLILLRGKNAQGIRLPITIMSHIEQVICTGENWNCRGGYRWNSDGMKQYFDQHLDQIHWYGWDPDWEDVLGFRGDTDIESPDGEWNQMIVVADGDHLEVYFNGTKVNEAFQVYPSHGKVQLEVEWAEFYVRRWELWPISGAPSPAWPEKM